MWRKWLIYACIIKVVEILFGIVLWWPAVFKSANAGSTRLILLKMAFMHVLGYFKLAFMVWGMTLCFSHAGQVLLDQE